MNEIPIQSTTTKQPVDVDGLRLYAKQNPVKFRQKYGDIDLDDLPENFFQAFYKYQVAQERARRATAGLPENEPKITPWLFTPRPQAKEATVSDSGYETETETV